MTSTNDGKEVKSNLTSGAKVKSFYIELYRSLEAGLSKDSDLPERTRNLCDAWRRVHSLCAHSAASTHPHLLSWLQRHTARTVLQTEWQQPENKNEHKRLEEAIDDFITESQSSSGGEPAWQTQLVARGEWFKRILANPWGHPVLRVLLDSTRKQSPKDEEILEWLKEERGVMFVTRLRQLASSKDCKDLALELASSILNRVRACLDSPRDDQPDDPKEKPMSNSDSTFENILKSEAGFTNEVMDLLTDIEFVLLHKRDHHARCIELAKLMSLRNGYLAVERLQSRLESSPREKKLWKNAKDVATLIAQVVITRCMVVPLCAGASCVALHRSARALSTLVPRSRLPIVAAALAAPAATAKHLHTLAVAVETERKDDMKPFVCELYVRAITAGMNELERLKLKSDKESEARTYEQTLSQWFEQLGALLSASERMRCECYLTAFSVHPSPGMYAMIHAAPALPPVALDIEPKSEQTTSEFGSWASDSRSQTNFVKTSETLNLKQTQHQTNVLSTAILSEGEALELSPDLCQDITVLLSGPRVKTLSWDMDRELLLENCRAYMERTKFGTQAVTTELKYLNLDPRNYQHLPEEDDDDSDMYYGIEKGYEHLVEFQEPEEIWQDATNDPERTESAHTTDIEIEVAVLKSKSRKKHKKIISSEEDDPLSSVAEAKRIEKKKERPHSKERSKERKPKTKTKLKEKDPLALEDVSTDINPEIQSTERKSDHSVESKKESPEKKKEGAEKKKEGAEKKKEGGGKKKESSNRKKDHSAERKKEPKDKEKKEKKERKRKEKTVQSQVQTSSLSSLIGMKVGTLGDRKPATSTTTDSDYDSQGKYSINSLLSEGNETDVIFDGLFSMDELKSPEKAPDQNDKMGVMRNNEVHITGGAVKIVGPEKRFEVPTPTNRTEQKLPTITADVKTSITKLIQFRRSQKYSNKNKQSQEHLTDPPRTYMKKPHTEPQVELRNDVNSYLNNQEFSPRPVIQYNQNPKPIQYNNTPLTGVKILSAASQSPLPGPSTSREVKANHKSIEMLNRQNPTQADLQLQKQESKIFHDFLKDLQASINAGAGGKGPPTPKKDIKPMNRVNPVVPKSEPKVSPSAKQTVKKPEVAPNTFSRLSYYKNRNENKTKRIVEAIIDHQSRHLESQQNVSNLEHLLTEHRKAKEKYLQTSDTVIKHPRPSENTQRVIKKTPSTSRDHPVMSNLLQSSPNLAKTQVVHNDRPWDMSTSKTSRLSSSSEQDLMRLLRQQSKMNLMRSKPETPKDSILPPPTGTSNLLPAHQNNIPSSKKINIIDCTSNLLPAQQNNIPSSKKINIIDCKSVIINPSLSKLNTSTKSDEVRSTAKSKMRNESHTKNAEQIHTSVSKIVKDVIDSEARSVKTKTNTKHADPTKQTDWESVMDALLKHKTPSRGPNALDMALNKDSSYMSVFENSLRNQRIVRPPSSSSETIEPDKVDSLTIRGQSVVDNIHSPNILRRSNTDNKDNKNKMTKQLSKVQKALSNPALEVRSNSGALLKPQHSDSIPILASEQKKIIVDSRPKAKVPKKVHTEPKKQQFTCTLPKEDDPFISGNLNSDYDLLEDLIDDELRKEIGESLLSDEDNYSSTQSLKDPKSFANANKTITTVIQPNKQTLPPPLIGTILTRPTLKKPCNNAPKPAPNPTIPIQQTTGYVKVNTVTNTQYAQVQTMPTIQTTNIIHQIPKSVIVPPMTEQTYVNTVTSIDQTYVAVPQPTALQNVVLIGSELVYQPCVQAPIHAGVAQNTYVTFNSQPNIAVYQTTQFAAPVVNPLIIGNAITTPSTAVAVATQNVGASTVAKAAKTVLPVIKESLKSEVPKLVNDAKIDIKNTLDFLSHDETIVKEKCEVNCNKNCERKVLSEVQEKLIKKNDSKTIKNRRLSFEHDIKKTADLERLKRKRMAILNRSIDHRSDNKPIPLTYSPLKNKKTEISKTQENLHNLRNTVAITDKVNDTSIKLESLINTKVKTITPEQIKVNEKDANENCKENKNEAEPCRRILLRSSNKLNSASAEKVQNLKAAPRTTKVRLKAASDSRKPEEIKSEVKKTKPLKRAPKKTLNKTIKKMVIKKRITRQTTKKNAKVNSEVEEKSKEEEKVTIGIKDESAIVDEKNVTSTETDETVNVEKEAVFADSIPELMDIEDQILGSMILKTGTTETTLTDVADILNKLEENENSVDRTLDVYDNGVDHSSPVSNMSSAQPIQEEIDASKSNDNNDNTVENTEGTNLDLTSNEATQLTNENTDTEIQDNTFFKNVEVDNVQEPQNLKRGVIETNEVAEPMITDNDNKSHETVDEVSTENIDKSVEKTEEERSTITKSKTSQDEKKKQDEADVICLDSYDDAKTHNGMASTDPFGIDNMENIPKAFLDAITVQDLPTNDPKDPLKKCVRIKLPNGRAFKATVRGQSNINVDTLFADPGLKSVLLSNVSNKNRYTLNIKQVSTSNKSEPGKILETKIQEIIVQKPRNPTDNIETINLLSDDENDENDIVEYFETEFGRYKVPAMNRKLHESHQKIFNKKCIMKLQVLDDTAIIKKSIPSTSNIIAATEQIKVPDVKTMESESISEDLNMFNTSKETMVLNVIASKSISLSVAPMIRDITKQTMNPEKVVPEPVAPIIRDTAEQIDVIVPKSILDSVVLGSHKQTTISDVITPKSPDSVVSGTNKQNTISDVITPKSPDSVVSGTNKQNTISDVITPKLPDSMVSGNHKQTTISDVITPKSPDSVVSGTSRQSIISDVITPKLPDSVVSGINKQTTISDVITLKSVPVHVLPNCQNVTPNSIHASVDSGPSIGTVNIDVETPISVPKSVITNVKDTKQISHPDMITPKSLPIYAISNDEDTTKQVKNPEVIAPKSVPTSVLPNIDRNSDVIKSKSIPASVTDTTKEIINPKVKTLKSVPTSVTSLIRDITKQIRNPDITKPKSIPLSVVSGTTKPVKHPGGIILKSVPASLPINTPKQLINSLPKGIIVSTVRSSEPEVIEIDDSSNDNSSLSGDENPPETSKTAIAEKSCEEKILEFKNLLLKDLGVQDTDHDFVNPENPNTVDEASVDFIIPETGAEKIEEFSEMILPDSPITELIIPDNLKSDESDSNNAHKQFALNPCYVKLTNCDDLVKRYNKYKLLKPCSIVLVRCDDNIPEANPNPEISENVEEPLSSPVNFNTESFVDDDMTPNTLSRSGSFSILNDYSLLDLSPLSEQPKRVTSPVMEAYECIAALGNRHTKEFTEKYEQRACEADWFLCKSRIHLLKNSKKKGVYVFESNASSSTKSNVSEVHPMNAPSLVKILTKFFQDNRMLDNYNPTYKETTSPQVSPTHNLKRKKLDKFQNVGKISKRSKSTSCKKSDIETVQLVTDSLETPRNVEEDIVIDKNDKDTIDHKLQPTENIQIEPTDTKVSPVKEIGNSMSEIHNSATPEQHDVDIVKSDNLTLIADEKQLEDSIKFTFNESDMTRTEEEKLNEETNFSETVGICKSTRSDFQIYEIITSTCATTIKHTTVISTELASEPESKNEDEDIIITSVKSPEILQNEESVESIAIPEPQQRTNEVMITKSNLPEVLRESGYEEDKNIQTSTEKTLQNFDFAQDIDTVSSTNDFKIIVDSSSNNTQNESAHKLEVRDKNQDNTYIQNNAELEIRCAFSSILEDSNNAVDYPITQEADSTAMDICVESSDNHIQDEANTLPEVELSAAEVGNDDSTEYLIPNEPRTDTKEIESETVNNTHDNVISSSDDSKIEDPVLSSVNNEQRNEGDSKTNVDDLNNITSKLEEMFCSNNQDENDCGISELLEEQNKRVTRLGDLIDHVYTLNDTSNAKENLSDKSEKKEPNKSYDEIHIDAITVSNNYSDSENALMEEVVDIHSDELLEEELAHIVLGRGASGSNDEKREAETTCNENSKKYLLEILGTGVQTTSTIEDYSEKEDSNKAEALKEHNPKSDEDKIANTDLITIGETCAFLQDLPKSLVTDIVEIHNNDELELELARIVLGNTDSSNNEQQILIINTDNLGYDEVKVCCIQQSELKKMVESDNHDINPKSDMIEYETVKGSSSSFQDYVDYTQSSEDILQITQEIDEYGNVKEIDIKLNVPKTTYSRKYIRGSFNYQALRGLKRKSDMTDARAPEKKYRKGKNIDTPKLTKAAILETTYVKEFNRLFDYCSSVKFSYSRPFHKEDIDVDKALRFWPSGEICDVETEPEINKNLFSDLEIVPTTLRDPLNRTLAEEIVAEYNESGYSPSSGTETNFQMGFGEGSGRVIQNSEDDGGLKFSAATLSDVKQTQPLLLSKNYDNCNSVPDVNMDTTKQEIEALQRNYKCIQLKDKVRSFFKKTMVELNNDWIKQNKKQEDIYLNGDSKADKSSFPFGLNLPDFINPPPVEVVIQVVQVGQLPVSAAAQNPVTCDPRVTQVSDASPSQCSADNGASDDPHSDIKTEYTELTTADISLPLQDYAQHHSQLPVESQNSSNIIMHHDFVIEEIKEEIKEEIEEEPEINDEVSDNFDTVIANNEPSPSDNNIDNNVDYTYETSPSPQAPTSTLVEANMEVMYSALETNQQSQITQQSQPAQFPQQNQQSQIVQPNQHAIHSQQNRQEQKIKGHNAQKQQTHIVQQSFQTQFPQQNQQAKVSPQNQQIQFVNQNQQPQTQVQISQPNQQVLVTQQNQQVHIQQNQQQHTIHSQQNQQAPVAQQNAQTHLPQQSPKGQLSHQNLQTQQQNSPEQQNGSPEKTDQIAHAMNAAGITTSAENLANTRAHALVNILSQKLRQGAVGVSSTNSYPKTTQINAMALQHALAQILPPPLNQTNLTENNQQTATNAPQVLHIVQGKNASGNQITLVDNGQPSVISTPNSTPVLHIVQNKTNSSGPTTNGTPTQQTNTFSGLSLVDAGLQQGNQLLHIVNAGNQKNTNAGQLLRKVNLLTNIGNVQGSNEQKMVQFVCKSADGKSIQLNSPHPRGMVLRLQPVESPSLQLTQSKPVDSQDLSPAPSTPNNVSSKETGASQQEIKSRSVYEENYAKFIQSSNKPTVPEKATSLPKFGQAFGKQVFQDGGQKNDINNSNSHLSSNSETPDCQPNDNAINLDHISQISSPPLLLRKSPQTSQSQPNLVQQLKQTISPMNMSMHGGVIYTRQIPVNIGGGQTINLITVPSTDLIDDSTPKHQTVNQDGIEPSIIKIVPQTPASSSETSEENNSHLNVSNETTHTPQPQQVLTQMRIKLPMLSKTPQMVGGTRLMRPSFFQIQRNVISGANQPVYQQLVLTAAPPLGQQTIRLPQAQTTRHIKVPSESQSSSESQMSSSTLEQLREFDLVLEQVKERSTGTGNGPPSATPSSSSTSFSKLHTPSTDTTDSPPSVSAAPAETTQQVLYSIGNSQPLNVTYVNRKAPSTTTTTSTFDRSPDSSGIVESPTSSTHQPIPHTVTSDTAASEPPTSNANQSAHTTHTTNTAQPKPAKVKPKSRPKASSNPPNTLKLPTVPPKTSTQKPAEDEQTTQRILYILAEYKEQVENSPDKDKPAPRRRTHPPSNPGGSSKRKKSSSGSRRSGRDMSPCHGEDTCRTMGSEDSSCGTSQGDCNESCLDSHSPQDSPRKVVRKLTYEPETPPPVTQPRPQPQRNVIVADGQTITVARGTAGKPTTAVLMPANYILPVSMVKGGQQIAIVTNRGPKLLTVGGGEGGATNALLLQRLIGPAGLKPVLARPGVRHVRLPTAALHNLHAFNLATATTIQPPDSTASPAPAPTPPDLIDTRASSSPWRTERESRNLKPERGSSPEGSEPWHLPPSEYSYEETVRSEHMDRTVLDPIPDRYSPDMEAQRIFDKMFDVDSKKSYMVNSHDDSPRCGYDIDASDCDDKVYHQVVHKKDGSSHRQHRLTHVSAAALRHKYAILEHELRLQKSLSEECEDLGVDSPSASELFPEAELLFAASPAHDHTQDQGHHSHTPQPLLSQSGIPQPDLDDQIATDQLLPRSDRMHDDQDLGLGLEDVGIVTVSEDGMQATIQLDQEEFARSHPNTTFHSEPTDDGEVQQPFTLSGLKARHVTSTIFHANRPQGTVLMTAPQTTVISQATAESSGVHHNAIKYSDIDNMINSLPGAHTNSINLSSVLVKDDGLSRFDNLLNDSRELHLSNTASAIVHSSAHTTQVIRRVCYEDEKRERDNRFLMDEPDGLIAGDDAKMMGEDSSRDATLESVGGDTTGSSPERHTELFWDSHSASGRADFSSDSEKCCKSPSDDTSTDSSAHAHMRLDSVIKEARGIASDEDGPPLRTYPAPRSLSGKTAPSTAGARRRASGRGVVKRGTCLCCVGEPAPPRAKKPRQRRQPLDFAAAN